MIQTEGAEYLSTNLIEKDEFRFSNLYQDGMVLQRGPESATIWGYGKLCDGPTAKLSCFTESKRPSTFIFIPHQEELDIWTLELDPQPGGYRLCTIEVNNGCGEEISIEEILFGDVYLCSGQSNMAFVLKNIYNAKEEIEYSRAYTNIRYTKVLLESLETPNDTLDINLYHKWTDPMDERNLDYFSAVCFLFARNIYEKIRVPIGLM